jgi:hypothetical protein
LILFTGRGTSGSWQVRGVQLGEACGAEVKPRATPNECKAADCIVVVKRVAPDLLLNIRASGRPWVLDLVDFYPQPLCTGWTERKAIKWVKAQIAELQPTGVIWPNQRMREDCDTGLPGIVLYHHCRPDAAVNPVRDQVAAVGYEGSPNYIGEWLEPIKAHCALRGWQFAINPPSLADMDIVIACRGRDYNGYAQSHWKSNVKLANAHGTGTPFVGPKECGYTETQTGMEHWLESPRDLANCLDGLNEHYHRQRVSRAFLASRYTVDDAARDLRQFLGTMK